MNIRYIHGKKIDVYCNKCDSMSNGTIMRERFRWIVKSDCGHVLQRGYVLPPKELERRGYVNYETQRDPRAIMTEQTMKEDAIRRWREQTHYYISTSPYCCIDGNIHTNPLRGISERELNGQKIEVVLELLEAIKDYNTLVDLHKKVGSSKENISFSRELAPEKKLKYNSGDE